MKNKTVIILLSVLAVALYTTAVINFCMGDVLSGIADVLMATTDALMAYAVYRVGLMSKGLETVYDAVIGMLEQFTKGVPATLTVKDGKGTITLGHDEDGANAPEEHLTEQEKRVKRMAEEYDDLRCRFEGMTQFRDTEAYKQMPDNKRVLYDRQCKAMDDYESALRERIRIEAKEANLKIDIKGDDTETAE
ncbi:MAG: hypothetical protein IKC86_02585 [Prevotella sp.]|nr:hypothetical protein [Prevotella sp.]